MDSLMYLQAQTYYIHALRHMYSNTHDTDTYTDVYSQTHTHIETHGLTHVLTSTDLLHTCTQTHVLNHT